MAKNSPDYSTWKRKKVKVAELFLDQQNIRLEGASTSSQEAIINDLFRNENAFQILESIVNNGFFPDESPVVIIEKGSTIVAEGNRRIASLKVIARPQIVPQLDNEIRSLIKENNFKPLKEVEVVIAPNRNAVQILLASKHTQNTRRPWKKLRQAYFYKAELERGKTVTDLKRDYPGVQVEQFIKLLNIHKIAKSISFESESVKKKINSDRSFPVSTLERLYNDEQVRDFLGFDFDKNGEVKISIAKEEFTKGFKKILQDAAENIINTRTLNSDSDRKKYLSSFALSETPKKTKTDKTITSKDFKESPVVKSKRTKLAPKDIEFSLQAPGVKRMLGELQTINYKNFPNASYDLLRSFLECALKAYFHQIKVTVPKKGQYVYLNDVLVEFSRQMTGEGIVKLQQVADRIRSSNMTSYSAQLMNAANHNQDVFAKQTEVEEAWDAMEPLFRYILNPPVKNA